MGQPRTPDDIAGQALNESDRGTIALATRNNLRRVENFAADDSGMGFLLIAGSVHLQIHSARPEIGCPFTPAFPPPQPPPPPREGPLPWLMSFSCEDRLSVVATSFPALALNELMARPAIALTRRDSRVPAR